MSVFQRKGTVSKSSGPGLVVYMLYERYMCMYTCICVAASSCLQLHHSEIISILYKLEVFYRL